MILSKSRRGTEFAQDPALESDPWWCSRWVVQRAGPSPAVTAAPPPGNAAEERSLLFGFSL